MSFPAVIDPWYGAVNRQRQVTSISSTTSDRLGVWLLCGKD